MNSKTNYSVQTQIRAPHEVRAIEIDLPRRCFADEVSGQRKRGERARRDRPATVSPPTYSVRDVRFATPRIQPRGLRAGLGQFSATLALLALLAALALTGCGGSDGPPRYDLSGKVTYKGEPVPKGYIVFTPDKKTNDGPGGSADIVDGKYQTLPGAGPIGGKHQLRISGFDGKEYMDGPQKIPNGKVIFMEKSIEVDLPKQSGTYDIVVPEMP